MHLQIITPENIAFDAEVDALTLPGKDGEFQILNNHAPLVATLGEGIMRIKVHRDSLEHFSEKSGKIYSSPSNTQTLLLDLKGGIVEVSNNKIIVLANQA